MLLSSLDVARTLSCVQYRRQRCMANSAASPRLDGVSKAAEGAKPAISHKEGVKFTAQQNYANMRSNLALLTQRPVSGYVGRWFRYQGPSLSNLEAEGDIIYGFREKDGFTQVWKAEEGDLDSPKLQKQREQLPQLQKDPLQLQLKMDALIVEVKADTPLLEPSITSTLHKLQTDPHPAGLATAMKLVAVPDWGNVVMNGGLPPVGAKDLPPPYQTWFNRLYLRVPGADGGKRWSVMVHYDTASGDLLTHYHNYETAIRPPPDSLEQVFTPGAHKTTLQQAGLTGRAFGSINGVYAKHKQQLEGRYSHVSYDDNMECTFSSSSSSGDDSTWDAYAGGPDTVEVWYDSGCYFRVPKTLNSSVVAGRDVILEAGVVVPASGSQEYSGDSGSLTEGPAAIVRWMLCYGSTGNRRIKWARHEVYGTSSV